MHCEPLGQDEIADLEIDEDLKAQRWIWCFERLGWSVLGLFLLAGLLGVFGGGRLSEAESRDEAGRVTVWFEQFARVDTPVTLKVRVMAVQQPDLLWLHLSKSYFDRTRIDRIMPEPERTVVTQDVIRFGFDPNQASEQGLILISLTPIQFGQLRGSLGLADGPAVEFHQIVYP